MSEQSAVAKLRGRVWKYGDNVDTDAIIPARYLNMSTAEDLAEHCMEDAEPLDPRDAPFAGRVRPGDIIVGGANFGCGSSREHAPLAIKGADVSCVVASSFARIFYRNAINIGLPILECPDAVASTEPGQVLEVDLESGRVTNVDTGVTFSAEPYPPFLMGIIQAGGLIAYTRARLGIDSQTQ